MNAVRRASWLIGAPFRAALIGGIALYRATLSGWLGGQCRFHPTCSHYADDAVRSRGALVGGAFAVWRILRCNPFGAGGLDPAPGRRHPQRYDGVAQTRAPVETA
jgi:uncharacterized protein